MQSAPPIKGRACNNPQVRCLSHVRAIDLLACLGDRLGEPIPDRLRSWLLEQLVGGAAVLADIGDMRLDPLDFLPQYGNPFAKLVQRQWAKVLPGDQSQRILRLAGKEVVLVHGRQR